MSKWFQSGRIIDVIVALVLLEALALSLRHRVTLRGPSPAELFPNLASGLCLMLAVRAALTGSAWTWVALALALSLVAHLVDLGQRWR